MVCMQMSGEVAEPYREFAQRWGNPEFLDYVKVRHTSQPAHPSVLCSCKPSHIRVAKSGQVLERQADEALAGTDQVGACGPRYDRHGWE